jgi:hypothetical protein
MLAAGFPVLILGVSSLLFPLSLSRVTVKREVPLCVLASVVVGILGSDPGPGAGGPVTASLSGSALSIPLGLLLVMFTGRRRLLLDRREGALFLAAYGAYLAYVPIHRWVRPPFRGTGSKPARREML